MISCCLQQPNDKIVYYMHHCLYVFNFCVTYAACYNFWISVNIKTLPFYCFAKWTIQNNKNLPSSRHCGAIDSQLSVASSFAWFVSLLIFKSSFRSAKSPFDISVVFWAELLTSLTIRSSAGLYLFSSSGSSLMENFLPKRGVDVQEPPDEAVVAWLEQSLIPLSLLSLHDRVLYNFFLSPLSQISFRILPEILLV